ASTLPIRLRALRMEADPRGSSLIGLSAVAGTGGAPAGSPRERVGLLRPGNVGAGGWSGNSPLSITVILAAPLNVALTRPARRGSEQIGRTSRPRVFSRSMRRVAGAKVAITPTPS